MVDIPVGGKRARWRHLAWGGIVALGLLSGAFALSASLGADPSVERDELWVDEVRRGEFVREVTAPGVLAPETTRWITADVSATVRAIHHKAGSQVEASTMLAELSNPELEASLRDARREYIQARAALEDLRARLEMERLASTATVAQIEVDLGAARRQRDASDALAEHDLIPDIRLENDRAQVALLERRLEIERARDDALRRGLRSRLALEEAKVETARSQVEFLESQVAALTVRAGRQGILQELPLEVGKRVAPGDVLAKILDPHRLGAEVRVAEASAADVDVGQEVVLELPGGGTVAGHVTRIDPAVREGTVEVDVTLDEKLPGAAIADLSVEARIQIERIEDAIFVGRPAHSNNGEGRISLFRLSEGGTRAERVAVELGSVSASQVQIRSGLREGDRVVLSEMSDWDSVDRIHLR